ncbi:MAG: hypothetical protein WCS37_18140 [Chloroflexota bacterium]
MKNIPLILNLGKNLTAYRQQTADHRTFTTLINQHFPTDLLAGLSELHSGRFELAWQGVQQNSQKAA